MERYVVCASIPGSDLAMAGQVAEDSDWSSVYLFFFDPVDEKEAKKFKRTLIFAAPIVVTLAISAVELGDGLNWFLGTDIWTWDEPTHICMIASAIWQIFKCYKQIIKRIVQLIDTYD